MGRWRRARLWVRWALRDARGTAAAGAVDRAAARARRRDVLRDEQHVGLARATRRTRASPRCGCTICASRWSRAAPPPRARCDRALAASARAGDGRGRRASVWSSRRRSTPRRAGARIIVPGRIVGTPPGAGVDDVARARAAACPPRTPAAAWSRSSATSPATTTCRPAGALTLAGGQRVPLRGQALAPEYFIVTAPGADFGAEAAFAVVFAPLRTAQALDAASRGASTSSSCACDPAPTRPSVRARLARSLQRGAAAHRLHVHHARPGARASADLQGRRGRPADARHLRVPAARRGDVRRVQPHQPHRRGAAARDRDRHGARRPAARARAPPVPARRARSPLAGVALGIPVGLAADAWLRERHGSVLPAPGRPRGLPDRTLRAQARRSGSRCHCSRPRCRSGARCA